MAYACGKTYHPVTSRYFLSIFRRQFHTCGLIAVLAACCLTNTAPAAVVDISGNISINTVVGAGNSGRLVGETQTYWGSQGFSVPLDLNGNTLVVDSGGGNVMNASGPVAGHGTVRFHGGGSTPVRVMGASSNTYTGTTLVTRGALSLQKTAGLTAVTGAITLGTASESCSIVWGAANQVDDNSNLTVVGSGSFLNLAGHAERIQNLVLPAGTYVDTGAGGVLNVRSLTVNGVVMPRGAYIAGSGYVTGSGYIDVDDFGPPVITDPPSMPASPAPADGHAAVHPATFVKLDWTDCAGAASYDVYLWTGPTEPTAPTANVGISEYTPGSGVASLTGYRWRVVAKNVAGTTAGPEWSFTTVARWDVSGEITHPNNWVGAGNTANLVGHATFGWQTGTCAIPARLNGFTLTCNSGGGNAYNYTGNLIGPGALKLEMAGYTSGLWDSRMRIGGGLGNDYDAGTVVNFGSVSLEKSSGNALCGPITVGSGSNTARLIWSANHQLPDDAQVTLAYCDTGSGAYAGRGTWLDLNGRSETIGALHIAAGNLIKTGTGGVLTTGTLTLDGTGMAAGTYTAASHDFILGSGSLVVTRGGGSAFQTWSLDTMDLPAGDAGFLTDADRDGLANGVEFVLGGHPGRADAGACLPVAARDGAGMVFSFRRMHAAAYLNPVVEFSHDLTSGWTVADAGNAMIEVVPGEASDTVKVTLAAGAGQRLFARMKVLEPDATGVAPRITTSPVGTTVSRGNGFTLVASAGGARDVTWQWYLDGRPVAGANSNTYTVAQAGFSHHGDYQVVATNALGNAYSAVARVAVTATPGEGGLQVIPWPAQVVVNEGVLTIPAGARIVAADPALVALAQVLAGEIAAGLGVTLAVATEAAADGDIVLETDAALTGEVHAVAVDTQARVTGGNAFAVAMGTATLLQALRSGAGALTCPKFEALDQPAVAIRALALDVARDDHSLESLLQAVDLCRLYKINYLHIHFNDDQAYTFPSAAYPLLNTVTANRNRKVYTLAEMQQLEAYAVARGVHIMPELEGPGHNALMLAAYPTLFKITYPYDPNSADPSYPKYQPSSSINVAKADVRAAVRTLMGEMCAVFQSTPYIHVGCDEVDWAWSEYSADFQAAFAEWGFNRSNPRDNVHLVFSKYITLLRGYAAEFGKQTIVWENGAVTGAAEVPPATDILVMPFDSYNPGGFVGSGFKLINAAWSPLYLVNHLRKPVSSIYAWDRSIFGQYSGENDEYVSHTVAPSAVLGTQLTTFEQEEDLEMMSTRARLAAMSERTWIPALGATYQNFRSRLDATDDLLDRLLGPVRITYGGLDEVDDRVFAGTAIVTMDLSPGFSGQGLTIRYTTDRTDVTASSTLYSGPFQIHDGGVLRAAAFNAAGQRVGRMTREFHRREMTVTHNLAANKPVTASSGTYAAKAVDLRDSEGWNTTVSTSNPSGEALTVDLQTAQSIDRVALLFAPGGTVFYQVKVSPDGSAWTTVVDAGTSGLAATRAGVVHVFAAVSARYVRLVLLPKTGGTGDKALREIMVTANTTTYDGINDPPATKTAWTGTNVAFLTTSGTRDPQVMDALTTTFDAVFDYYAAATGRLPDPYLTYQGKSLVAEVASTCGAGCGYLGATGIELESGTFDLLYQGVRNNDQYEQTLFYEFGRNFYFYDGKIRYKESGPMAAPAGESGWIGTGYAVLMRFASMDATGVKPAAFGGTPFATFRASVEGMVDAYVADPALDFSNTLLVNRHPPGGGTTDFFASLCLRLAKSYGPQVLTRMWREIGARPDAATTQDAVDNWFLGCCYGADRNLAALFTGPWKIPLSSAAQAEALQRWGAPP